MFHELLMVLNGYTGNIFYENENRIKVSDNIPNIHPAEKKILERLCDLASKYKYINEFAKTHRFHHSEKRYEIYGLYLESFCDGLDVVLSIYHNELIKLEEEIINDPFLTLTYFLKLEEYHPLFQVLSDMISFIITEKIHGCRLLEVIYNHSSSGIPLIEMAMNKIQKYCQVVMYRQVYCWMMHGYVEDPYEEFFIQPEPADNLIPKEELHPFLTTSNDIKINYVIKPTLLPTYIPSSLAAKILFVGQYVSILGETKKLKEYAFFVRKEESFAKQILQLSEEDVFSILQFERTIDVIRKKAAEHLWQAIVKGANFKGHLQIMKDFYLLGRGELFLDFIVEANQLLRMPVTTSAENDVNKIFQNVARTTLMEDDSIDNFHVSLEAQRTKSMEIDKESLSKIKLESGWSTISLLYAVPHPLQVLITHKIIRRYNIIFRFLLNVRRIQIELHQCWALQMQKKENFQNSFLVPLWDLRSHMSFLIDNFQYYILVDVLETRFTHLLEKINSIEDFEAIQEFHNQFLSSVRSQCFLELKPVYHCLMEIMEICSSFCHFMHRIHIIFGQREIAQFENIKQNFQKQTSFLFRILSGIRSHQVSPHLAQLLLRIDYNKYLSNSGGHLGGYDETKKFK